MALTCSWYAALPPPCRIRARDSLSAGVADGAQINHSGVLFGTVSLALPPAGDDQLGVVVPPGLHEGRGRHGPSRSSSGRYCDDLGNGGNASVAWTPCRVCPYIAVERAFDQVREFGGEHAGLFHAVRVFLAAPAAIRLAPDIRGASLSSSGLLVGDPAAVEAERDLASMWTRATGWPEKSWAARMTRSAAPQSGFGRRPYRSRRLRRHRGGEGEDRLADGGVPPELVRLDGSGSEVALEQGVVGGPLAVADLPVSVWVGDAPVELDADARCGGADEVDGRSSGSGSPDRGPRG
jgi:hypothetical protein